MQTIYQIIISMRPHQWIKNLFIFAALVFSEHLLIVDDVIITFVGFIIFSLIVSSVYILNDLIDVEKDKLHPLKSKRPIASGMLKKNYGIVAVLLLASCSIICAFFLNIAFALIATGYLIFNVFYSLSLKKIVIIDVMSIAFGFVLRIYAGAVLIKVPTSEWLIICTILIALFLGFSKRRTELVQLENNANTHRIVLGYYSEQFLDQMIGIVTASTVMSYALYTISDETISKFGTKHLIYTVPFVLYGIFRYLYLVHKREEGWNPALTIVKDIPMMINLLLWFLTASTIIYWR